MIKKIAIIGHFGGNNNFTDGQTVKTKKLYDELSDKVDWDIYRVDTYYKSQRPVKLLLNTLYVLFTRKDVIVLLSKNGLKLYLPLLSFFTKIRGTRVYHDVIGGNLCGYIEENPKYVKYLNSFQTNWVESENLKLGL